MNCTQVLRTFSIEWYALINISKEKNPDVPHLSKNITPIKCIKYFTYCLLRTYGICDRPFLYVIRDTIDIPDEESDPIQLG